MDISPKQFLKARRPGQFSDPEVISESQIDSTVLEYYLDTLNNRSQEIEFERFGIRLCKACITPNLLPNTGPTGGGDSKVDSETYPVSEATALGWYTSIDPKSANERWGFAFSIQKDWGAKVRDDVKKIFETGRGYKVAYFISSRFIRSKDRARVEDELRKSYQIDVRILDRNWILKEVFENKRQEIVREELHIEGITETKVKKGPLDSQKEEYLATLDKDVENAISQNKKDPSIVDDAIRAAILSREIEKLRVEIDGRFTRAQRLAKEFGNAYQQFEAVYQFAWTTFWWHEDFPTYIKLYQPVEDAAINSDHVYNLERLTNLWYGLNNLRNRDEAYRKLIGDDFFDSHTKILKNKLQEISDKEEEKPNAALYARTLFLEIELAESRFSGQKVDEILAGLKKVIEDSRALVGFPFKPLIQVLTEIGEALEDSSEYDGLFQTILKVTEERDGEIAGAKLSLARAEKLIELEKPYEALKTLGVSLGKLYKHETRDDAVRALYLISVAYEEVGLLWAARGSLLTAASLATSEFWNYGDINTMQAACYKRLKWIELRLGRLPQTLDWHHLDSTVRNILVSKGFHKDKLFEQVDLFGMALGILFLRSDLNTLKTLEYLPDALERLDLFFSSIALIYALGQEGKLPADFTAITPPAEMDEFFKTWAGKASRGYLPGKLSSTETLTIQLFSTIVGCKVVVNVENQSPCIEVAESILAAMESFLSTAVPKHATAKEPSIEINIDSGAKNNLIEFRVNDGVEKPIIEVSCKKFNPHSISREDQGKLKDLIFEIIVQTMARFISFRDFEKDIDGIMGEERASDRALNFTGSFITLGNVLGHNPHIKISEFINKDDKRYELKRSEPLKFEPLKEEAQSKAVDQPKESPFPKLHHTDIETISIIREPFWDEAKWLGAGYYVPPDEPPVLIILFTNIEGGRKIFSSWQKKFGREDKGEEIKVSIVQGIDKNNPLHYVMGIGSNIKPSTKESTSRFVISPTRRHTMTPETSKNLDGFKVAYKRYGFYLFAPGSMDKDGSANILFDLGIVKREISVRQAWEIGANDLDLVLVDADKEPVIPSD